MSAECQWYLRAFFYCFVLSLFMEKALLIECVLTGVTFLIEINIANFYRYDYLDHVRIYTDTKSQVWSTNIRVDAVSGDWITWITLSLGHMGQIDIQMNNTL